MGELEVSGERPDGACLPASRPCPGATRWDDSGRAAPLPRRPQTHLMRVYAYARFVDDVGDEASGDRLALLDAVEADNRRDAGDGHPAASS